MNAKQLILKGLGKAKVRNIIKHYMIKCFNESIECNVEFTFALYQTIYENGLPIVDDDDPFTIAELVEFVGGKI